MGCKDNRGAVGSVGAVKCVHLKLLRDTFSKDGSRNLYSEILLILCCFLSCAIDHCAAIGHHPVANTANLLSDVVDPLVSAGYHHFVENDLLCAEDDAILTDHSKDSATVNSKLTKEFNERSNRHGLLVYLETSTALSAYST